MTRPLKPLKPYAQHRLEIRAQAAYDFIVGVIKWAALLVFLIWWCEVPYVT
jgi:hypothetical protein